MQQYFYALTGSTKIPISHTHRQFAKVCAFQGIWIHNIFKSFVLNGDDCHFFTAISHGGNIFKWHASKCHKLVVLHDVLYMQHLIPASFNLRNSFTLNGSSYLTSSWLFELWFSNEKKQVFLLRTSSLLTLLFLLKWRDQKPPSLSVLLKLAPVDGKS